MIFYDFPKFTVVVLTDFLVESLGFYTQKIISFADKESFISSCLIAFHLFFSSFSELAMTSSTMLISSPCSHIRKKSIQVFIIKYGICCRVFILALCQVEEILLFLLCWEFFIMN